MAEELEDVLTRIARLRDEEYEPACLILARVERLATLVFAISFANWLAARLAGFKVSFIE